MNSYSSHYPLQSFVNIIEGFDVKKEEYKRVKEMDDNIKDILKGYNCRNIEDLSRLYNCRNIEDLSRLYNGIRENTWKLAEPQLECEGVIDHSISLQEASEYTFHYGKYNKKTLQEVFVKNQSYLKWLLNNNVCFLSNYIRVLHGLENYEITLKGMEQNIKEKGMS